MATELPRFALAALPNGTHALVMTHADLGAGKWWLVSPQLVTEVTNREAIDALVHLEPVAMELNVEAGEFGE